MLRCVERVQNWQHAGRLLLLECGPFGARACPSPDEGREPRSRASPSGGFWRPSGPNNEPLRQRLT